MRLTKQYISPTSLFLATWSIALIAAYFGPKEIVYQRYGVVRKTFTLEGMVWIIACTIVFLAGVWFANRKLVMIRSLVLPFSNKNREGWESWKIRSGFIPSLVIGCSIISLLIYWTILAITEIGSIPSFFISLTQNWHSTGDLWIAQKPFIGARLAYTGLVSVAIFASSGLAYIKYGNLRAVNNIWVWLVQFLLGVFPLMILPLFVSQRVLLATAIFGSIITYVAIRPNGISVKFPILGGLLGFTVWTAQEIVRVGFSPGAIFSSISYGVDRLLLYFSNDIGNLNRGLAFVTEHTYGLRSFKFIFRYLFVKDTMKSQFFESFYSTIGNYKAGGTFTALGEPYIDFGVFGLFLIFAWGYGSQLTYLCSKQSVFCAQLYGLLGASIVLSWHFAILSNVYFWFNIALLSIYSVIAPSILFRIFQVNSKGLKVDHYQ